MQSMMNTFVMMCIASSSTFVDTPCIYLTKNVTLNDGNSMPQQDDDLTFV